ncbi:microcin C ABC transporter permease YejB [Desulfobotulus mexicanus]|uniref:Microcin C ABC transporter permease YejB n=1 Tax=Desulfobotulus mexicanus TaxID=2586642 RepID=A0A5S5MF63_9BACT|nr:microcin C ABC transporter permease YejB [Desulfobotulus mexicanus]TYT74376.1 microcin C ABC transporter permease YejB [Desulfobotulus mexicanus]
MIAYIAKRVFLLVPTLLGILALNFFLVQLAPGGPVEQVISRMEGRGDRALERITGAEGDAIVMVETSLDSTSAYRGRDGISPELVAEIERRFGFDRPLHERFFSMLKSYLLLDFGESFFKDRSILGMIGEKMPVSLSLGLWSTLVIYLVSIPLGIRKAVRHGSPFDVWTSFVIVICNSIPVFLFAVILIVIFAGGSYLEWFPLRGLVSDHFHELSFTGKVLDYFHHLALPILAMTIGGIAGFAMLTKNCFLDEIRHQYVTTARAKGASEGRVLFGHVFRNAMLIVIAGLPGTFLGIFFTGSMMIEVIFSLDGLGLMGFEATMNRDYPVMFAGLYISTLMGLFVKILSDITYVLVDPRIHFDAGGV